MDEGIYQSHQEGRTPRRTQPILSCFTCKRMKLKCDRNLPCQRCCHNGRAGTCAYAPGQEPGASGPDPDPPSNKRQRSEPAPSPAVSEVTSAHFDDLQARVRQLESALATQHSSSSSIAPTNPGQPAGLHDADSSRSLHPIPCETSNHALDERTSGQPIVKQVCPAFNFRESDF